MKITFKFYDDMKAFYNDLSKDEGTILKNQQNPEFNNVINSINYKGFCKDFDAFLKVIAGKTFKVQSFEVMGTGLKKAFSIETSEVGADGGLNTNFPFNDFYFIEDVVNSIDWENEELWACRLCGKIVNPKVQKDFFNPKNTLAETGIENAVCPLDFTRSYVKITD